MGHVNTLNLTNNFSGSLELSRITFRKMTNSLNMRLHIYFAGNFGNLGRIVIVVDDNCAAKVLITKAIGHLIIS